MTVSEATALPSPPELTTEEKAAEVRRKIARPVMQGQLLSSLSAELKLLGEELGRLRAFEMRVFEAALTPSAWVSLRKELAGDVDE